MATKKKAKATKQVAKKATKKKTGRPRAKIDWVLAENMAKAWCLQETIAAACGVSLDTLDRACPRDLGIPFADFIAKNRGESDGKLGMRMRVKAVEEGDTACLIFLCKNRLGMADRKKKLSFFVVGIMGKSHGNRMGFVQYLKSVSIPSG